MNINDNRVQEVKAGTHCIKMNPGFDDYKKLNKVAYEVKPLYPKGSTWDGIREYYWLNKSKEWTCGDHLPTGLEAIPLDDFFKGECEHEGLTDTGAGYYTCPACKECWTYKEWQAHQPTTPPMDKEATPQQPSLPSGVQTMCFCCNQPITETGTAYDGKPCHIGCYHTVIGDGKTAEDILNPYVKIITTGFGKYPVVDKDKALKAMEQYRTLATPPLPPSEEKGVEDGKYRIVFTLENLTKEQYDNAIEMINNLKSINNGK